MHGHQSIVVKPWPALLVATISAIAAAFAFAPALQAGITPEDFGWLTLARHLDSPLPLLHENVFFVYFYRPTGLLFWWLSGQWLGTDAWLHNAADLTLHAANAALLALLALRLLRQPSAALLAGLLFACAPAGVGTAMWLSDRFDPLALLFGLLALHAFESIPQQRGARPLMALFLLLALTAKEVAYALAATLLLRLAWNWWSARNKPWHNAAWIGAAIATAIALRLLSGTAADNAVNGEGLIERMLRGTAIWWWRLPRAWLGYAQLQWWQLALLATGFTGVLVASVHAWHQRVAGYQAAAITGIGLVLLPCLLQWPIVALALGQEFGLISLNLRFYYLASGGIALLGGAALCGAIRPRWRGALTSALLVLCATGLLRSREVATQWANQYAASSRLHQHIAAQMSAHQFPPGCIVQLDAAALDDDFRTHADTIIKAGAPRQASVLGCAIFAGRPVFNTIVTADLCRPEAWPALQLNHENGHSMLARIGNLCTLQFAEPDRDLPLAGSIQLHIDRDGTVTDRLP